MTLVSSQFYTNVLGLYTLIHTRCWVPGGQRCRRLCSLRPFSRAMGLPSRRGGAGFPPDAPAGDACACASLCRLSNRQRYGYHADNLSLVEVLSSVYELDHDGSEELALRGRGRATIRVGVDAKRGSSRGHEKASPVRRRHSWVFVGCIKTAEGNRIYPQLAATQPAACWWWPSARLMRTSVRGRRAGVSGDCARVRRISDSPAPDT